MLIPLNLPQNSSKALSIVALPEGYSIAEMTLVNSFGLATLPSWSMMAYESLPGKLHWENGEQIDPIAWLDEVLCTGPDLLQCLDKAMDIIKSKYC